MSILYFCVIAISLMDCVTSHDTPLTGIEVKTSNDMMYPTGTVKTYKRGYKVFYNDVCQLYKFNYFDERPDGDSIKISEKSAYLAFARDSSYGYEFQNLNDKFVGQKIPIGFLLPTLRVSLNLDSFIHRKADSSSVDPFTGILKETLLSKDVSPEKGFIVRFYYTTALNRYAESFNKYLDSLKRMKLFKVELTFSGYYDKEKKISVPIRYHSYEMTEVSKQDVEEANKVLKEYQAILLKKNP